MKLTSRASGLLALIALFVLNSGIQAHACSACFGDTSGSKQSIAATWGIFAMVVIMFVMLGTIIGIGFYFRHLEKNPLPDYNELLSDDHDQPNPETSH
jgi:hypothetical protein